MGARVSVRIRYERRSHLVLLLTLALVVAGSLGYLAWSGPQAAASTSLSPLVTAASMRQYYVTKTTHPAAEATTACAAGYHMASLWEILDTSNLRYNTTLGYTYMRHGKGPPTEVAGWVRTGYISATHGTPGQINCSAWTSPSLTEWGTRVWLISDWTSAGDIHVWQGLIAACGTSARVWCVEDYSHTTYLPLTVKNF